MLQEIYRAIRPPASLDPSVNHRLAIALERGKEGGVTKANVENVMAKVSLSSCFLQLSEELKCRQEV